MHESLYKKILDDGAKAVSLAWGRSCAQRCFQEEKKKKKKKIKKKRRKEKKRMIGNVGGIVGGINI